MEWIEEKVASPYGDVRTLHWAAAVNPDDSGDDELTNELGSAEDELGAVLWNSNTAALNYLHKEKLRQVVKNGSNKQQQEEQYPWVGDLVLELGAGVGCLGIALAFAGAKAFVTDLKELVPLMKKNIEINVSDLQKKRAGFQGKSPREAFSCEAVTLRWGDREFDKTLLTAFDQAKTAGTGCTIVMCDALYGNAKHWPMLISDLKKITNFCGGKVVAYNFCEQRVQNVEKAFVEMLQASGEWEVEEAALEEQSELKHQIKFTKFSMKDEALKKFTTTAATKNEERPTIGQTNKKTKMASSAEAQTKRGKRGREAE